MTKVFNKPNELRDKSDLVDLSEHQIGEAKRLTKKIKAWIKTDDKRVVAFVGKFGSGKTVTLKEVEKTLTRETSKVKPVWLNFEAWRYTDRGQLWDGFVSEAISAVREEDQQNIVERIDGVGRITRHPLITSILAFIGWSISSYIFWIWLSPANSQFEYFVKALIVYALPVLFAMLALIGVGNIFNNSRPLSRVFQLEKHLSDALKRSERPLVVVAEDIDRAGDEGVVFLETLRSFLKKAGKEISRAMIVIAPQDITYISVMNEDKIQGLERSVKIYDSVVYYASSVLRESDAVSILKQAKILPEYKEDTESVLRVLVNEYSGQLSVRLIKFILREVSEYSETYDRVNPAVALVLISARYLKELDNRDNLVQILPALESAKDKSIRTNITDKPLATIIRLLKDLAKVTELGLPDNTRIIFTDDKDVEITYHPQRNQADKIASIDIHLNRKYEALLT